MRRITNKNPLAALAMGTLMCLCLAACSEDEVVEFLDLDDDVDRAVVNQLQGTWQLDLPTNVGHLQPQNQWNSVQLAGMPIPLPAPAAFTDATQTQLQDPVSISLTIIRTGDRSFDAEYSDTSGLEASLTGTIETSIEHERVTLQMQGEQNDSNVASGGVGPVSLVASAIIEIDLADILIVTWESNWTITA